MPHPLPHPPPFTSSHKIMSNSDGIISTSGWTEDIAQLSVLVASALSPATSSLKLATFATHIWSGMVCVCCDGEGEGGRRGGGANEREKGGGSSSSSHLVWLCGTPGALPKCLTASRALRGPGVAIQLVSYPWPSATQTDPHTDLAAARCSVPEEHAGPAGQRSRSLHQPSGSLPEHPL